METSSPKTPPKVGRPSHDDSFKTCKATLPTPKTRRLLRMTPARTSILSGGNPFKEAKSSGKKFNSRRKNNSSHHQNDTVGSNETFLKFEQELMFDRDSLEVAGKPVPRKNPMLEKMPELAKVPIVEKNTPQMEQMPIEEKVSMLDKETRVIKPVPKKKNLMPPPAARNISRPPSSLPRNVGRNKLTSTIKKSYMVTPRTRNAESRYLTPSNRSCLSRAQSFKSTAELEKDYFSSLRSF